MLGHDVFHMPMGKEVKNLPWFETDVGVRRLSWALGVVLLGYWGWFLTYLALSMHEGLVVPKVLVGLVPLALLGAVAVRKPRVGGLAAVVLGLVAAAVMVPFAAVDVAVMVALLSLLAGGLMFFSAHK